MADPTGGGLSKSAGELMKQMQEVQEKVANAQGKSVGNAQGGAEFQQQMEVHRVQEVKKPEKAKSVTKASRILAQAKAHLSSSTPAMRVGRTARTERSKIASMLEGLVNGQNKMNKIMNLALSGKQFSPQELLALQAGVYHFSQELELTSKVIEKATSGVKQTMNTQV